MWPIFSKFGMQAKLIMGGGPHMSTMESGPGGNRWSLIISSLMKPLLYFQPEKRISVSVPLFVV